MAGYETIVTFLKNIHIAKDKILKQEALSLWVREIINTGADVIALNKAEIEIIRNEVPLDIGRICKEIKRCVDINKIPITTGKCRYCGGRGYVYLNLYFDNNGKFISDNYALACVCNSNTTSLRMVINSDNNRTECKNGYFRCFNTYTERENYIKQIKRNNGMDIKRF